MRFKKDLFKDLQVRCVQLAGFFGHVIFGIRTAIYRSLRALRARNPQKVSKKSPRASRPRVSKKSRKESKSPKTGSYELSASRPCFAGKSQESSYEPEGSDVVRELLLEPAMFQIGL